MVAVLVLVQAFAVVDEAAAATTTPRIPRRCHSVPAERLCAVHWHHQRVNVLRHRLGYRSIPYGWMAERRPRHRGRILSTWTRLHARWHYRWQHRLRVPWSRAWLSSALCIHRLEGAWTANTGNGYYGGMQMDSSFESAYGGEFVAVYGTADHWPPHDQLVAAYRAWRVRGWSPWPNTSAACGL